MTYTLDRRTVLTMGGAAVLMPASGVAATAGTRSFRVTRDGSDIGTHRVSVTREGDSVRARTEIDIAVKILGITAYRYELYYTEVYRGGLLQSFTGEANDDGDKGYARITRAGDMLQIDGSKYSGLAPGNAVPTSYWRMAGLQSTPWISAQSGEVLPVTQAQTSSRTTAPVGAQIWQVSDAADYDVEIWYDAAGDWTGCAFEAGGELGVYTLVPGSESLVALAT